MIKLIKILRKLKLLDYFSLLGNIKVNNTQMRIPLINGLGYDLLNAARRECWLDNIIQSALKTKKGTFIDIGVNLGQTLLKVKSTQLHNKYIGFEPNSICSTYVKKLISVNNWHNCQIIPVGLANESSVLSLFMNNDIDPSASIAQDFRDETFYSSRTYVPVFQGDYLLSQLGVNSISVIKVDVEGAELEVIQGLQESIAKYNPYILCEVLPVYNSNITQVNSRKRKQDLLENLIKESGYKIYRIMHDGKLMTIDTIGVHSDLSICEYIFVPEAHEYNFFNSYLSNTTEYTNEYLVVTN